MASIDQRLALLSVLPCALAASLAFVLASYKVEQSIRAVQADRISLMWGQVRKIAENNSALGITPAEMRTLLPVIQRQKASDPSILSIDVSSPDGRILHSTEPGNVDAIVAPASRCSHRVSDRPRTQVFHSTMRIVGGVYNSFDGLEACASIDVNTAELKHHVERSSRMLMMACLLAWVVGSLLLFLGLRFIARQTWKRIEAATHAPHARDHADSQRWRQLLEPWRQPPPTH